MYRSPQHDGTSNDSLARLQDDSVAKNVYFYKDGDTTVNALRVAVHPRKYRSMDALLGDLSRKIPGLAFGVRSIFTPGGHDVIKSVERLENDGRYVCSTYKNKARGVDILKVHPPPPWHLAKPRSGQRELNRLLKLEREGDEESEESPQPKTKQYRPYRTPGLKRRFVYARSQATDSSGSRGPASKTPKRLVLIKNTEHSEKHVILLNRRTAQTFEQVLMDISGLFRIPVRRLYTLEGMRIHSLSAIFNGPEHYVVCGKERFQPFDEVYQNNQRPVGRKVATKRNGPTVADYLREKRERLNRTRGRWRVWITTSELPQASTAAQVSITVYGEKGNSGPIPLGDADGETFQAGNIDEFEFQSLNLKNKLVLKHGEISVGNIGFIYKIRVAHDNSAESAGWFCEEVAMRDLHTNEELVFRCDRWLSRDEDDSEICRELPAIRPREPVLPVLKYQVTVVTGDYWNAGTDAHIYMTIYGERGDTGVRQLYKSSDSLTPFQKGQTDTFQIEAVSLGALRRVIVGHDGDGPGNGWYLDRVVIREGEKAFEECVFPCNRWLDEGEDDAKIVRELKIQDEYMHDLLEKEMWEYEKWKYAPNCQIMLFSKVTRKALRIRSDGRVDGLGEIENDESIMDVVMRKGTARMLKSAVTSKYLTINEHRVSSMIRHGPACELKLKIQPDRSVRLQSLKYSLQHVVVRKDGFVGDPRGAASEPNSAFLAYCKGMFRDEGLIMLCTSLTQTVAIQHDNNLYGTGKRNRMAHFVVHKVSEGGIRMFESSCFPDQYIRLKDGQADCQGTGDQNCHFRVHRFRELGFVTLESVACRGLYIGLTPDGQIRPTVDTGDKNVRLFPEVLKFGRQKEPRVQRATSPDLIPLSRSPSPQDILRVEHIQPVSRTSRHSHRSRSRSPRRKTPSPVLSQRPSSRREGEWKVWIESVETGVDGEIGMMAYGEKGTSDSIVLGSTNNRGLFQAGHTDEFKIVLGHLGDIYKIRLELTPLDKGAIPTWRVGELRMQDQESKEVLRFKFNRWISCLHDNLETMRELPVIRPRHQTTLEVFTYQVYTETGYESSKDLNTNVYITLYGQRGDTGKRLLNRGDMKAFERGQVDLFTLEAVDLGRLTHCVICRDRNQRGEGWFCREVIVREKRGAEKEYVFTCNQWLDATKDDRKTSRVLNLSEYRKVRQAEQEEEQAQVEQVVAVPHAPPASREHTQEEQQQKDEPNPDGEWRVSITTGEGNVTGLDEGSVLMYAYGENYHIGPILIGNSQEGTFRAGHVDDFTINLSPSMGDLRKIRIGHDELDTTGWFLEKLEMKHVASEEVLSWEVNRWMSRTRDDCEVWRELPVSRPGTEPLPLMTYIIHVYTGSAPMAETEANVYMNMFGSLGDCGMRGLYRNTTGEHKFQRGGMDIFLLEAVYLGDLEKVHIGHDGEGEGNGWYLEKLEVIETEEDGSEKKKWTFNCGKWLDEGIDDKTLSVMIDVET